MSKGEFDYVVFVKTDQGPAHEFFTKAESAQEAKKKVEARARRYGYTHPKAISSRKRVLRGETQRHER